MDNFRERITERLLDSWELTSPTGMITLYSGDTAPGGWAFCDGSEVLRDRRKILFGIIGIKFGEGDGETTFNLPNIPPLAGVKYMIRLGVDAQME